MQDTLLTPAGLKRRLKRHVLKEPQTFFAATTPGFEGVLEREVRALPDVTVIGRDTVGVEFSGPIETVYHAAARFRTANRLVMRVATFTARSYPELYNKVKRIPIELYSGFATRLGVEASAGTSRLHHTGNIEQAVFDGCRDLLLPRGIAVERDNEAPIRFMVRLKDDVCTISLDASGPLLYKRGYRLDTGHAPLRESIAAGLLLMAQWQKYPLIADPLCGSGTFIIEAALLALGRNPRAGLPFAFEAWPCLNEGLWNRIRKEVSAGTALSGPRPALVGSDASDRAVEAAVANAERAGVADYTSFSRANCLEFPGGTAAELRGLIISNMPYGKRATADGSTPHELYRKFGERLRTVCRGWSFGFVVEDPRFAEVAGLTETARLPFSNGGLDVYFVSGTLA